MPKHYVGSEYRLPHEIKGRDQGRDLCIKRPLVTFEKFLFLHTSFVVAKTVLHGDIPKQNIVKVNGEKLS